VRFLVASIVAAAVFSGQPAGARDGRTKRRARPPEGGSGARSRDAALRLPGKLAFSGLTFPTNFRLSSDGRVFVAEKSGLIKVFGDLSDTTPTIFADLRTQVDDYWDRGLLGLALDPAFPRAPYVYVLYTYDAPPGRTAPVWKTTRARAPRARRPAAAS
jgi:hypothetical protein